MDDIVSINPVLVELHRGPMVESRHRGAACVCTADGTVVAAFGDVDRPVPPRSAVKPIQALPVIESGAADAFGFGPEEIALACASHAGTDAHVDRVAAMLDRIGLHETALACGGHAPTNAAAAEDLVRAGRPWSRLHDNCSGKHAAFLALARHLGVATAGYETIDHPVQTQVAAALEDLCGVSLAALPHGIDGCGIPVWGIPLRALATGMARMANPDGLPAPRQAAITRIRAAMAAHPLLIAGPGRFDTALMEATGGRILTKVGAEGVQAAIIPELGLGVALKIDDGTARAPAVALGGLLDALGHDLGQGADALAAYFRPPEATRTGVVAGALRPSGVFSA